MTLRPAPGRLAGRDRIDSVKASAEKMAAKMEQEGKAEEASRLREGLKAAHAAPAPPAALSLLEKCMAEFQGPGRVFPEELKVALYANHVAIHRNKRAGLVYL